MEANNWFPDLLALLLHRRHPAAGSAA